MPVRRPPRASHVRQPAPVTPTGHVPQPVRCGRSLPGGAREWAGSVRAFRDADTARRGWSTDGSSGSAAAARARPCRGSRGDFPRPARPVHATIRRRPRSGLPS